MIRRLLRQWFIRALGVESIDPYAAAESVRKTIEESQ